MKKNNLAKKINDYYYSIIDLRSECKEFIIDFVKKYGKEEGNGDYKLITYDIDENGEMLFDEQVFTISVNSGYDINQNSLLQAINVKGDLISFDTEDAEGYDFNWVDTPQVIDIADFLIGIEEYLK